jgi:hypothetical protein
MPREVAVVTGAGRGIGKEIAINLSKGGLLVIIFDYDIFWWNLSKSLAYYSCLRVRY